MQYFNESLRAWLFVEYAQVAALLEDERLVPAGADPTLPVHYILQPTPKEHVIYRRHFAQALQSQRNWMQDQQEKVGAKVLARVDFASDIDVQSAIILPFCHQLAGALAGVSADELPALLRLAQAVFDSTDGKGSEAGNAASVALAQYFVRRLSAVSAMEANSLLGFFAQSSDGGMGAVGHLVQLLVGVATSLPLLLGNSLLLLLTQPIQADFCRRPLDYLPEVLRLAGPAQMVYRHVLEAGDYMGQGLVRGDKIALCLAQANRDGQAFADPDAVIAGRVGGGHLSFGRGGHACLGASLIRSVCLYLLPAVLDKLAGGGYRVDTASLRWGGTVSIRGVEAMRVCVTPF